MMTVMTVYIASLPGVVRKRRNELWSDENDKTQHLRWLGHLKRMDESKIMRRVYRSWINAVGIKG